MRGRLLRSGSQQQHNQPCLKWWPKAMETPWSHVGLQHTTDESSHKSTSHPACHCGFVHLQVFLGSCSELEEDLLLTDCEHRDKEITSPQPPSPSQPTTCVSCTESFWICHESNKPRLSTISEKFLHFSFFLMFIFFPMKQTVSCFCFPYLPFWCAATTQQ